MQSIYMHLLFMYVHSIKYSLLMVNLRYKLIGWLIGGLAGWLAGWLAGCLAGWLAGWLAAWLSVCLAAWRIDQPTD